MKLEEYLLTEIFPNNKICLLWFDESKMNSKEFHRKEFNKIEKEFLEMEVMDTKNEDDCKEIWIR